jgi:lipid-A-disaccharide synthase
MLNEPMINPQDSQGDLHLTWNHVKSKDSLQQQKNAGVSKKHPCGQTQKIILIAGEPSGDVLGQKIIAGLKKYSHDNAMIFDGIGGPLMMQEGTFQSWIPLEDLAQGGIIELIKKIPFFLRHIRATARRILKEQPALLITIDAPEFTHRIAKILKKRQNNICSDWIRHPWISIPWVGKSKSCKKTPQKIPIIHFVAPSVWAWRPGRAKKLSAILDHLCVLFPFEPPYFLKYGLKCTFVGHPLVENVCLEKDVSKLEQIYPWVKDQRPLLLLLPGSRSQEIKKLTPIFLEAFALLKKSNALLTGVFLTLPHLVPQILEILQRAGYCGIDRDPCLNKTTPKSQSLAATLFEQTRFWHIPSLDLYLVAPCATLKNAFFQKACWALAASGTVTLELAHHGIPTVVGYKLPAFTGWLIRCFLKIPYVTILNYLGCKTLFPEFLQKECRPEKIAVKLEEWIRSSPTKGPKEHALGCLSTKKNYITPTSSGYSLKEDIRSVIKQCRSDEGFLKESAKVIHTYLPLVIWKL